MSLAWIAALVVAAALHAWSVPVLAGERTPLVNTCAIRGSGQALCWGDNAKGQFGDGTTTSRLTPGVGPALGSLTAVTAGGFHPCALDAAGQPFCWGQGGTGVLGDGTFADRLTPVTVPSFSFNIDPEAELGRRRRVEVTALAACLEGAQVQIRVRLTQDGSVGHGFTVEACTGALERYAVRIHSRGRDRFEEGPAQAEAEAIVRQHGRVIDVQEWTRDITIDTEP